MKYNPIPFGTPLLHSALEMKQSGLLWTPEKGCFVWDPQAVIQAPSPFPNQVYFILNMRRFLNIFGDTETMQDKLVWLPTWHQAAQLCRDLGLGRLVGDASLGPEADSLARLYRQIASELGKSKARSGSGPIKMEKKEEQLWMGEVIAAELGSLEDLPEEVQRWIRSAYKNVTSAYLGWRRIQEQQDDPWLPPERFLEPGLLSELGHFFSDYQHQIRTIQTIRKTMQLIRSLDPKADPNSRDQLLRVLIDGAGEKHDPDGVLEQLMAPIENHAIS